MAATVTPSPSSPPPSPHLSRYAYGQLVEINSHSLFSKWFSEVLGSVVHCVCGSVRSVWSIVQSGKLVQKMFQKIQELIEDSDALICVLIDEVSHSMVVNSY